MGRSASEVLTGRGHGLPATVSVNTFTSNTAAANLFIPIGVSFATQALGDAPGPIQIGLSIALAALLSMTAR